MEKASNTAEELYELGRKCIGQRQLDEAERYLALSLKDRETANAWRAMAVVHRLRGHLEKAEEGVREALALNTRDDAALALLGEIHLDRNDLVQAVRHYVLALAENPAKLFYKQRFVDIAGQVAFHHFDAEIAGALLECLKTPEVDCSRAQILWYTLLASNDDFKRLYRTTGEGGHPSFDKKSFDRARDLSPLLAPFFLLGLGKIVIYHPVFEEFLTHLRGLLLEDAGAAAPRFTPEGQCALCNALASYCFYTEYIFDAGPDEKAAVAALKLRLETGDAEADPRLVALYACYAPLHRLQNAAQIAERHAAGPVADTVQLQITDYAGLQKRRAGFVALTPIDDAVSVKVRAQYEEFPYPCWKSFSRSVSDEQAEGPLRGRKARILVAGCGTGKEAIELGAVFPDAAVLAVDLSRASLAYAAEKASAYNIGNVTFRQADILKLGGLREELGLFDYISSSGVLHHLAEPLEGWKVLRGLLKDGGLMRVALYSRLARRHLSKAQAIIRESQVGGDAESMKAFRRDGRRLLPREVHEDIANRGDYYHLSMYRDLLFHAQEHQFDIPGIAAALEELKLEFIKFGVTPEILALYRQAFPGDPEARDLSHWHSFEQKNPDAFSNMYHFWCRAVF